MFLQKCDVCLNYFFTFAIKHIYILCYDCED